MVKTDRKIVEENVSRAGGQPTSAVISNLCDIGLLAPAQIVTRLPFSRLFRRVSFQLTSTDRPHRSQLCRFSWPSLGHLTVPIPFKHSLSTL